MRSIALALAALLAGCTGNVGTLRVSLVTAPESAIMDDVVRLRVTLTEPETVVEAVRDGEGGFTIDLEVTAEGVTGFIEVEGFDADGDRIAFGRSGPLPIAAITDDIAIYVGAPLSVAAAPEAMEPARAEMAATRLGYGVLYAGGRDAAGAPVAELAIYNVYAHALLIGDDMPVSRADATAMSASGGIVFVFGGRDAAGDARDDLYYFDTNVAPAGAWTALPSDAALARAGARAAPIGGDYFLVTGDPLVRIDGIIGRAEPFPAGPPLEGTATSVLLDDIPHTLVAGTGAGATGAVHLAVAVFTELDAPAELSRTRHGAAVLPGGDTVIAGGTTLGGLPDSVVRYNARSRDFTVLIDALATPRTDAGVAATDAYVVVAGGRDEADQVLGDLEVLDAATLEPVAILPLLVPRAGAGVHALPNGQVLIAGGVDAAGAPIATLELFTPDR